MQQKGFPTRWRDWRTNILKSASSRVRLYGAPGPPIRHWRELRQGDPLSHLLFVLAIDPLHLLLEIATSEGLLIKLDGRAAWLRTSLYADDAAIFIYPSV